MRGGSNGDFNPYDPAAYNEEEGQGAQPDIAYAQASADQHAERKIELSERKTELIRQLTEAVCAMPNPPPLSRALRLFFWPPLSL